VAAAMYKFALLGLVLLYSSCLALAQNKTGNGWSWYCIGDCDKDTVTTTTPGVVLMGGGPDVVVAFKWMIARSGGGNFVVLRAAGTDAYNPFIYEMGGIKSVATLILTSKVASTDPFVLSQISNAEAIWFAGGDQSQYISYWNNTAIQTALQTQVKRGVPIGGTSAGMAVLGQFIYAAMTGNSATSSECLQDPYNKDITLGDGFLTIPYIHNIITDMHFVQRDRMGRSITFLSRLIKDKWVAAGEAVRAVCADEQTAVLLDPTTGVANITSPNGGYAYFLQTTQAPSVCAAKTPLSIQGISVHRVQNASVFDFGKWSGNPESAYQLNVAKGVLTSTNGKIY
jgi:cyanophycinase